MAFSVIGGFLKSLSKPPRPQHRQEDRRTPKQVPGGFKISNICGWALAAPDQGDHKTQVPDCSADIPTTRSFSVAPVVEIGRMKRSQNQIEALPAPKSTSRTRHPFKTKSNPPRINPGF
jgi:hypothetical protein